MVVSERLSQEIDRRCLLQLAMRGIGRWMESRAARTVDTVPPLARPFLRALAPQTHTGPLEFLLTEARVGWEATEVMTWPTSNS